MKKNDEDQPGWRRTAGHLVQHLRDGWPAAIFVATLFTVLDHAVGWLDAIDGHGFVAIGNAAGALQMTERSRRSSYRSTRPRRKRGTSTGPRSTGVSCEPTYRPSTRR
jgi:hypothetical protein